MRLPVILMSALICTTSFMPAALADDDGLALPPEGHVLLNLSATETKTLAQDLLMASLRIEAEADTPVKVQSEINNAVQKAMDMAKKENTVKASTGGYYVYKNDPNPDPRIQQNATKEKKPVTWRGSQTINLESKDAARLLDLVGKMQGMSFVMNNLSYTLSPELAESVRDDLMVAALGKLKNKASIAAKTLGKSGYEFTDVSLEGASAIQPMYKAMAMRSEMAMDAAMPAPTAEPGETDVSMTVSARALLKP